MPPGSPPDPRRRRALDALLVDLGPQLRRGPKLTHPEAPENTSYEPLHGAESARIPSGYSEVDTLVGGGFPRGQLSEISGPASSGRTSLALGLLATVTQAGELAAVVDGADAFDPLSAESVGVDLDRVLWARAPAWREALRCCERLLETEGIPLVLLDLASEPQRTGRASQTAKLPTDVAWLRLSRLARASRSGLVVLSQQRLSGSHAEVALEMQSSNAHFSGTPALLEELEIRAVLARHRALPIDRTVLVRLGTRAA
jgi:hypothetical protein